MAFDKAGDACEGINGHRSVQVFFFFNKKLISHMQHLGVRRVFGIGHESIAPSDLLLSIALI